MARGYTTRKLEVWSLHAHRDDNPVDYRHLFRDLSVLPVAERIWTTEERLVAIPHLAVAEDIVRLIAYEGPLDERPIILSVAEGAERGAALDPGEIVATKTHALVDLAKREAIIEYNHRGAKAQDVAATLGIVGRRMPGWHGLYVELAPQVEAGFVEAVEEFARIRVASMRLARPNFDWEQWRDGLTDSAADSDAGSVSVEMNALRGESLAKSAGIVKFIKARVGDAVTGLKSAAVTGTRVGENAETRVTTADHKTHQRVSVRLNDEGQVDDRDIDRRIDDYHASRDDGPGDGAR
jgi:hypothetical protein